MCENPSVRWQICECLTLLILLRLTTAAAPAGMVRFWTMPGAELDEHHMLWCLNSLDSAACAVRWAMWQEKYADWLCLLKGRRSLLLLWESAARRFAAHPVVMSAGFVLRNRMRRGFQEYSADDLAFFAEDEWDFSAPPMMQSSSDGIFYAPLSDDEMCCSDWGETPGVSSEVPCHVCWKSLLARYSSNEGVLFLGCALDAKP